ncbi:MAG: hypothetical protein WBO23_10725 [Burkholderiales bacterium]
MSLEEQIAQTVDPTLFTRLCNSLFTAEHGHSYQVVDGTRGDEGNDGWLETECRIFAIHCPLKPERRTDADYRDKAYADLKKAALLRENKRYPVERWTFVTPRKLSNDVIVEIRKRAEEFGLKANHVEATYLSGLLLKHPELVKDFPDYQVSQIEELLKKALESPEVKQPKPSRAPEHDIFSYLEFKKAAASDDTLKEVFALRESADRVAAKHGLRALVYRSTNPLIQINAVVGLMDLFDPVADDLADLTSMCESARRAAKRIDSKSAEAYLLAQRGFYQSFEFGRLAIERYAHMMAEQAIGLSLEDPAVVAQRQKQLEQLSKGYSEAFKCALELAQESKSGTVMAAVLISIGNAAGQRSMTLMQTGPKAAFEHERDVCKRALLTAKDIYAQLGDEHEVANAQFNLANQIRFLGEVEEAKELVKAVIPVAEKYGDDDLRRKAGLLEERLRTGKIPNYMAGEKSE